MIEVHNNPEEALSDKDQALLPDAFAEITLRVRGLEKFLATQG